jgi:hypothetical protein
MASEEVRRLFEEDQRDRRNISGQISQEVVARDRRRREKILDLYQKSALTSPEDQYRAAMILQHGETAEDYQLANELSAKAMLAGYEPAKWLTAASEDRLLLHQGKLQRYGTQYNLRDGNIWELHPVDPTVSDLERARYNVPPLDKIEKIKNRK